MTGSQSGLSARFGQDIAQVARNAGLDILVQRSEGILDTIRRLMRAEGTAVGFMPSDVLSFMSAALPRRAEQLRVLLPLYHEEVHLLARQEIQRVEDLDGKRVIIGTAESGTWLTAQNLLRLLEVQPAELMRIGQTNALFWPRAGPRSARGVSGRAAYRAPGRRRWAQGAGAAPNAL